MYLWIAFSARIWFQVVIFIQAFFIVLRCFYFSEGKKSQVKFKSNLCSWMLHEYKLQIAIAAHNLVNCIASNAPAVYEDDMICSAALFFSLRVSVFLVFSAFLCLSFLLCPCVFFSEVLLSLLPLSTYCHFV